LRFVEKIHERKCRFGWWGWRQYDGDSHSRDEDEVEIDGDTEGGNGVRMGRG